jgi:drug/metabolite transporter (DMT)-like permease
LNAPGQSVRAGLVEALRGVRTSKGSMRTVAIAGLIVNAFIWGTSWWPLRYLQANGLHPLWATALIYAAAVIVILVARPRSLLQLARTPSLWVIAMAAGTTNASFNWGVVVGDVVRVLLLFYLMPLWAVLLARLLLNEPITPHAGARLLLALTGAAIVLWPASGGLPLPSTLPDWLGVLGGFAFALNNVMLRREAAQPAEGRALAMFGGGALVSLGVASLLVAQGSAPWPPAPEPGWLAVAALMVVLFLIGNLALQFGASRLRASVTAVVMLTEIVFGAVSSLALGAGALTLPLMLGGALILLAALLSAFGPATH